MAKTDEPLEKFKLAKDPMRALIGLNEIEAMAKASAEDFKAWDESLNDPDEDGSTTKVARIISQTRDTHGRYMMRLKLPNGLLDSTQARYLASVIEKYGDDGCCDITTRQNIQLKWGGAEGRPEILRGLEELKMCSLQSGLDNVRNATGNPLAGFDPCEIVDTRPYTLAIQDYATVAAREPAIAKFGTKVERVRRREQRFLPSTRILTIWPSFRRKRMGDSDSISSSVDSSLPNGAEPPLYAWVPENEVVAATHAVLTTFRDYGHRGNRQKCRMMWLIDEMGLENFRAEVRNRACRARRWNAGRRRI